MLAPQFMHSEAESGEGRADVTHWDPALIQIWGQLEFSLWSN